MPGYKPNKKTLSPYRLRVGEEDLAVTYFRMGRPHTIIGDTPFHC